MENILGMLIFFGVLICLGLAWFILTIIIKDNSEQEYDASSCRDKEKKDSIA